MVRCCDIKVVCVCARFAIGVGCVYSVCDCVTFMTQSVYCVNIYIIIITYLFFWQS
jgi:hypothetical protein